MKNGSGEDYVKWSFTVSTLTKYYSADQVKKNEMGRAYGIYGRQESCVEGLVVKCNVKRPLVRPRHRWDDNT
jgi:hypothetical protein